MFVLVLCTACSRNSGPERFTPSIPSARGALDRALQSWQQGDAPGRIDTVTPAVQVSDSQRLPGQVLRKYEILSEVPGPLPRCFAVRLNLDRPAQELKAVFVVFGQDPIWVFRVEDYEMLIRWDHDMGQERTNKSGKR